MSFSSLFSPIAAFLKASFFRLAALDGKPGLSETDFEVVLSFVRRAANTTTSNEGKASIVKDLFTTNFSGKVPAWLIEVLVWLAYSYAKRKGVVA